MFSCPILVLEIDVERGRLLTVCVFETDVGLANSQEGNAWSRDAASRELKSCRLFVVIRNGMKSIYMCECDLNGWMCFSQGHYICYKNMVYICSNMLCAHHKTRQETSYYYKTFIANNN